MANKVSIIIKSTDGKHVELTNSKNALMLAHTSSMNWESVFGHEVGKYDIIFSDFTNPYNPTFGLGYYLLQRCASEDLALKILDDCRTLLKEQYNRMMMIRVAKKYKLDESILLKIELEYHDSKNYEIDLTKYFEPLNG